MFKIVECTCRPFAERDLKEAQEETKGITILESTNLKSLKYRKPIDWISWGIGQ